MMNQVYKTLPDDRPITSICIVEDVDKCPKGYVVVSRTHDQDSDADLWRENTFFGKKCTRYICLSKSEGTPEFVINSLAVVLEKELPPKGYTTLTKTFDTGQKAWRKKQICYKSSPVSSVTTAVTDIIICSRMKKAPEGFQLSGEINGMTLCYKMGKSRIDNGVTNAMYLSVPYSLSPLGRSTGNPTSPTYQNLSPAPPPPIKPAHLENGSKFTSGTDSPHDYELLIPLTPMRPAPKPPVSTYATISGYNGLEGVPFVLNPKLGGSNDQTRAISLIKQKTKAQIDEEYSYEFRIERQT